MRLQQPDTQTILMNHHLSHIFHDLAMLRQKIQEHDPSLRDHEEDQDILALVRIIRGMTPETWHQMEGDKQFPRWFPLALNQDTSTALQHIQEQLDRLAFQKNHDPLTQLPNRHVFETTLQQELARACRFNNPLSLCILDLDDFKAINDTYGHPCGDQVLRDVAKTLRHTLRQTDIPARIGGEEFAIILPETGLLGSQRLLHRVQSAIRELRILCPDLPKPITIRCSMGLATCRGKTPLQPSQLYTAADQALYKAKAQGKDKIESAPILDLAPIPQQTLVLQEEKQFLFAKP